MTVLEALAMLEAAVLHCKKRNIDTSELREAFGFLEPHIQPDWLIPQYREHALDHDRTEVAVEGQQQVLRATFPGVRESVRELIGKQMDALASFGSLSRVAGDCCGIFEFSGGELKANFYH